jgi:hypothetical protein
MALADHLDTLAFGGKTPAEKLREALELYDDGVEMQRLVIARRHPSWNAESLEKQLSAWLRREGDASDGD